MKKRGARERETEFSGAKMEEEAKVGDKRLIWLKVAASEEEETVERDGAGTEKKTCGRVKESKMEGRKGYREKIQTQRAAGE